MNVKGEIDSYIHNIHIQKKNAHPWCTGPRISLRERRAGRRGSVYRPRTRQAIYSAFLMCVTVAKRRGTPLNLKQGKPL
jgi:hypothetical protein